MGASVLRRGVGQSQMLTCGARPRMFFLLCIRMLPSVWIALTWEALRAYHRMMCFTFGRGQSLVRLTRFHDDVGREMELLKCQLAFSNRGRLNAVRFCGDCNAEIRLWGFRVGSFRYR